MTFTPSTISRSVLRTRMFTLDAMCWLIPLRMISVRTLSAWITEFDPVRKMKPLRSISTKGVLMRIAVSFWVTMRLLVRTKP